MRDNMPNYLNMYNMDPSRVEAAPMRNAKPCGLMLNAECGMLNCGEAQAAPAESDGEDAGAEHLEKLPGNDSIRPGQKIGTVAFVGRGCPKFEFSDTAKPFDLQPITMSNAEAIEALTRIETDIYGRIAIAKAIDALRGTER